MDALPSSLLLSLEGMVFAPVFPWFWPVIAVIVVAAWSIGRLPITVEVPRRRWSELCIPYLFPVAILVWANALAESLEGKPSGWYWQELGIFVLLLLQVVAIVWLLVRHRGRLYPALAAAAVAVWWSGGAIFVAEMTVYNDWL